MSTCNAMKIVNAWQGYKWLAAVFLAGKVSCSIVGWESFAHASTLHARSSRTSVYSSLHIIPRKHKSMNRIPWILQQATDDAFKHLVSLATANCLAAHNMAAHLQKCQSFRAGISPKHHGYNAMMAHHQDHGNACSKCCTPPVLYLLESWQSC